MRRLKLLLAFATMLSALMSFGVLNFGGTAPAGASSKVTLTLWDNYGGDNEAVATAALTKAFTKLHPNITFNIVSQPGTNYFSLLSAAAISGTGPDLAVEWTGQFDLLRQSYELNLKSYLSASEVASINGASYAALNFNTSKGLLVVPYDHDSYIGYYNKSLFAKAGIKSIPTDWSQLFADCSTLKTAGIQPMVYGNTGALVLGEEFYPWYDMTYLIAGEYPPSGFTNLYSGKLSWTSPTIEAQLAKWDSLQTKGCTNSDVLTNSNTLSEFVKGKAAMIIDGTWDSKTLIQGLGSKLGVFVPPYSNTPIHSIVQYPGDGYSVMKYSKHIPQDIEFEKFILTEQAAKIIESSGVTPNRVGFVSNNPVVQDIEKFIQGDHYTVFPMLDNIAQTNVVNTGSQDLDATFAGDMSATAALKAMAQTWQQLPPSQK